mgnify:FL=1
MLKIKDLFFAKVLFFLSFITLSSALFIEHILGHPPCSLCIFQRIPYIVCFLICGIFLIFKNFDKFFLYSILIIFLIAFILSFYHVGLEQGFFKESFLCSTSTQEFEKPSELLKELKPLQISCKNITFRLLGFSLATLNLILSLAIMIITINRLVNYEKYK